MLQFPITDDPYTRQGFEYFSSTYGIVHSYKPGNYLQKIILPDTPAVFNDTVAGWISILDREVPVFEKPGDLTGIGEPLSVFSDNAGNRYPCVVRSPDGVQLGINLFSHMGRVLSGELESVWKVLGARQETLLQKPFMDDYGRFLVDTMAGFYFQNNIPFVRKSFWPEGRPFAVCLTHDIDEVKKTYQWITRPLKLMKNGDFSGLCHQFVSFLNLLRGHEPYWTFEQLVECESRLGVTSSLYFLDEKGKVSIFDRSTWRHAGRRYNWKSPEIISLLRDLHEGGWEVGLHGSFYSFENPDAIRSEKKALEEALGELVSGVRQHNLNIKIPDTWIFQQNAGLSYDTTLGYNRYLGFRWGTCHPFHPYPMKGEPHLQLLEIPLVIEDLPFFRHPDRRNITKNLIRETMDQQGVLTLLWHHTVFNEHEYPGWGEAYKRIIEYCKLQNAWITNARAIARWWMERENENFAYEYSNNVIRIIALKDTPSRYFDITLPEGKEIGLLEKAIIMHKNHTTVTICTSPLNFPEYATIKLLEICHGYQS